MFAFDREKDTFEQTEKFALPKHIIAFDIGDRQKDNLQSLYFLTRSSILQYRPNATKKLVKVNAASSIFLLDEAPLIEKRDFIMDINGDGIDDAILQHFEQLNLWLSDCCGKWTKQQVPITPSVKSTSEGMVFSDARIFFVDIDGDDLVDVLKAQRGGVDIFMQTAGNSFSKKPRHIDTNQNIFDLDWWEVREADGLGLDQNDLSHKSLGDIRDVNGDNIPDLVVSHTKSSSVFKRTNNYEFYFGSRQSNTLTYK